MNLSELKRPFAPEDIEWRLARAGISSTGKVWASVLAYITARAVMERLDEVVGPENWKDRYWKEDKAVMCGLSIKIGDEWVEKMDGSEESDIEAVKGGISGAFKRAAVKWGVGSLLYKLTDGYADIVDAKTEGAYWGKTKEGKEFYWLPPKLPSWALPENYVPKTKESQAAANKTDIKTQSIKETLFDDPVTEFLGLSAEASAFRYTVEGSIESAKDATELHNAIGFYNAKIKLGAEGKTGGITLSQKEKDFLNRAITEKKDLKKKELGI